jgi:hypothetical protein
VCTLILLRRPGSKWPLLLAANRDEMADRAWRPPGRHWADRADVVAGQDLLSGGSWLGLNDHGVVAAILNRYGSLGPAADKRSRGELVLEALDHADAQTAADALAEIEPLAYRSFNAVVADNRDAYWIRHLGDESAVVAMPLPPGLSMITARNRNDTRGSPRQRHYLPLWRNSKTPDPDQGDWQEWEILLGSREEVPGEGPASAMNVELPGGFGTLSSSLIALPADIRQRPIWRFAAGPPDRTAFEPVDLETGMTGPI